MRKSLFSMLVLGSLLVSTAAVWAESNIKMVTRHWGNDQKAFQAMDTAIQEYFPYNLLANAETQAPVIKGIATNGNKDARLSLSSLFDGTSGTIGGWGRVGVTGKPARLVLYLGKPRTLKSIRLFSGNVDTRSNQDFEVRLANNEKNPGKMPTFPKEPTFTTGPRVIGGNNGAFSVYFERENKVEPLFEQKYDWVEFLIWQTYPAWNGHAGKSKTAANSWSSYVEIQVVGDPKTEPSLFKNDAERKAWELDFKRNYVFEKIRSLGADYLFAFKRPEALKRAITDLVDKYPEEFKNKGYEKRWEDLNKKIKDAEFDADKAMIAIKEFVAFQKEVLLKNPAIEFEDVLVRKATRSDLMQNWISNASRNRTAKYGDSLVTFSIKDLNAPFKEIAKGPKDSFIGDISLHWDAKKCLVTALADNNTWQVFECDLSNGKLRQVTPDMGGDVNNVEGCYVPDGSTIFISSASMMGVPCIGGSDVVGNVYRVEKDGKTCRQLTFEQDQDWCPVILENGRILYLRWEYIDIPHYFSRILMTMNPDGTNQVEHYGSGSFWPNSLFYAKPLPGQSSKFVGIVSGHHGIARSGELVVFDPSKGRQEEKGVVQRIPDYGKKVEPVIADQLVRDSWPQFLFPNPIAEDLFLVTARLDPTDRWAVYLVDMFDNIIKLKENPDNGGGLFEATPIVEKEEPQRIPDRTVAGAKEATYFITDVYFGQGLPKVPVGTVKKLRIYALSYGYRGIGGHSVFGMESCWDARRILGEVPVFADGSATFKVPANTPLVLQPLDKDGAAVQLMRSWFVGMPGETGSCIGCHETQNSATMVKQTEARGKQPMAIENFYGQERPFAFETEIQPVLDKYCAGCHNGEKPERPNFADNSQGPNRFSKSYHALHGYVRRSGPESDIHVFRPMEYHVSTSELVQMLRKGHHNVKLSDEAWRKLYAWIDLNVPYFGTWMEVSKSLPKDQKVSYGFKKPEDLSTISNRYIELKKLYAGLDLDYEADTIDKTKVKRPEFVKPVETPDPDRKSPKNWAFDAAKAKAMQGSDAKRKIDLDKGLGFEMVRIPAGEFVMGDECGFNDELPRSAVKIQKPFWMMTTEVTNDLYALFDASHDSRFIDQWNKDHTRPGYPANLPKNPVIRISWQEATDFCKWLSEKTGKKFRLPTEAEWEWAARAGSAEPMWFGKIDSDFGKFENLSDESTRLFVVRGIDPQPYKHQDWEAFIPRANGIDDGHMIQADVASYLPNPWGLYDMIGNVAEWTKSDYRPFPYVEHDGRNNGDLKAHKVAKGGSWRDRPKWGRAGVRRDYESWQKVFNVGFRVVCDD